MCKDVKLFPLDAQNAELRFLDRETWVYKEHLVLTRYALRTADERAERACYRPRGRHTGTGTYLHIDEGLDKLMGSFFQLCNTCGGRILRTYASIERSLLCLDAIPIGRQSRTALIHAYEGDTCLLFQILSHQQNLTDGSVRKVGHVVLYACLLYQLLTEYFHSLSRKL